MMIEHIVSNEVQASEDERYASGSFPDSRSCGLRLQPGLQSFPKFASRRMTPEFQNTVDRNRRHGQHAEFDGVIQFLQNVHCAPLDTFGAEFLYDSLQQVKNPGAAVAARRGENFNLDRFHGHLICCQKFQRKPTRAM